MTTKELKPLRRKDIATGRARERKEIVAWLRSLSEEENGHMPGTLANWIEAKMHEV